MHQEKSEYAGQELRIKDHVKHLQNPDFGGSMFRVEDWWDHLTGKSWRVSDGNPACMVYAIRAGFAKYNVPTDDEVLYGKVGPFGHLVHVSELELPTDESNGEG